MAISQNGVAEGANLGNYLSECSTDPCTTNDAAFSAIVCGNYYVPSNGGGECEGRLAVGGNLTIEKTGYTIGASGGGSGIISPLIITDTWAANDFDDDIVIGGNVSGNIANYWFGDMIIGGSILGTTTVGFAITVDNFLQENVGLANVGIDFEKVKDTILAKSAHYATYPATGSYVNNYGDYLFTGDGSSMLQVFYFNENMDGWGLTLADIPSGATIIFNISGNTRSWGNGGMLPTHKFKIVYNFYEATSVTLSKDVQGSVLIPNRSSTTYLTGNIDGRFICGGNFEHNGGGIEIHNYQFTGTLPKPPSPFPINLIGMHLQSKDNGVSIIWETASEENNDYFTIEHSVDNTNWDIISTTKGAGNSSTPITYEAIDYNPSLGVNYYRLKQTDYDGKSETFTTRSINIKSNSTSLQIYPNPSSDYVNVIGQNFSISDFHIYDITGKSINSEVVISSIDDSTYKIDISKLKSGIYLIRYLNLSKMITKL